MVTYQYADTPEVSARWLSRRHSPQGDHQRTESSRVLQGIHQADPTNLPIPSCLVVMTWGFTPGNLRPGGRESFITDTPGLPHPAASTWHATSVLLVDFVPHKTMIIRQFDAAIETSNRVEEGRNDNQRRPPQLWAAQVATCTCIFKHLTRPHLNFDNDYLLQHLKSHFRARRPSDDDNVKETKKPWV